ncbi:MAG: hypothetical protein IT330_14095, partial [Anaerolineae bacterium]|nr:hypothetical protein [Anaerolineae bacterium]
MKTRPFILLAIIVVLALLVVGGGDAVVAAQMAPLVVQAQHSAPILSVKSIGQADSTPDAPALTNPDPLVIDVSYPQADIIYGETVTITLSGANNGGNSPQAYLVASFPDISNLLDHSNVTFAGTNAGHNRVYYYGESMPACYGTCARSALYPSVQAWDAPWNEGWERYLRVRVVPDRVGFFRIFAKMVAQDNDSQTWFRDPSSGTQDHQVEYVYVYSFYVDGTQPS